LVEGLTFKEGEKMHIKGDPPDPEGVAITVSGKSVVCPLCETIWQLNIVLTTFSPEEQERFWVGKGCPDCRYQWTD
jgi:ssDNA-binding Zn-finger/Zn-ribbon topoisomerase 1